MQQQAGQMLVAACAMLLTNGLLQSKVCCMLRMQHTG